MTDEPVNPVDEERAAIARIGFTEDGVLLHRFLRRVLETVVDMPDHGALLSQNGRRSLARDLMRLMAEGIGSDRSSDAQPLVPRARAVSVARTRGVARRVGPSTQPLVTKLSEPGGDAT